MTAGAVIDTATNNNADPAARDDERPMVSPKPSYRLRYLIFSRFDTTA
jgi:hypothetical protein